MKNIICENNGRMLYNGFDLTSLAQKYGTPLKLCFLDLIKRRVCDLKNAFNKSINANKYRGKFIYLNANKANYNVNVIATAGKNADGFETSSYNDLLLTESIMKKCGIKNKPIFCNGFKDLFYRQKIVKMINNGFDITPIVDSIDEYYFFQAQTYKRQCKFGLRIHLECLYGEHEKDNDRFGLMPSEVNEIIQNYKNFKDLELTTIHFHQRGFGYEEKKFICNIKKVFEEFYVPISRKIKSVCNFNIGGGTPLPHDTDFNYEKWSDFLVSTIQSLSKKNKIFEPNIISENGKYTAKDSFVNIYQVVAEKNTDVEYPWQIINGSFLVAIAEYYESGEPILVSAINQLQAPQNKARLAGITCDCDDVFFDNEKGFLELPKFDNNEKLYIAIYGTGSYQDSLSGKGGTHHCLIPEEKNVMIYTSNNKVHYKITSPLQDIKQIKKVLGFSRKIYF